MFAVAAATPVFAQTTPMAAPTPAPMTPTGARPGNVIGTDNSLPTSNNASNIDRADTKSPIAPRLPAPGLAAGSTPSQFLAAAKTALRQNHTGECQEALERAETRMLDRSIPQGANPLDVNARIGQVREARDALAHGDRARAGQIIDTLLASAGAGSAPAAKM